MSIDTLSHVAIETVGRYERAAQHLARAYLGAVERAARSDRERFAAALQQGEVLLDDRVKTSLIEAQQRLSELAVQGLQTAHTAVSDANERTALQLKEAIERTGSAVNGLQTGADSRITDTLALLGLPSAQLSLSVATALADGAERLETQVAGGEQAVDAQPAARKAARRGARA